ncbi:chromate efflux transporter [Neptuniibacter halophilus]|uniref:chromate efflux transporter n=1 Tax=Neptuniibacter halophilus TaxID=651666 RepID=UPI002573517F|nr:chromate efflux transporter [Neptuniibacter halophilus]
MKKVWEVFWRFLVLGCSSFGGPAAHLGYFQRTFVQEQKWIDQQAYARLISLSQFLPGPGSSQVGFALGLRRAGLAGGLAAFLGFTLPSFLIMYALAISGSIAADPWFNGLIHGLKLLAVVVVADATLNMQRSFCKENTSLGIAVFTAALILLIPSLWTQMLVLILAALAGTQIHRATIEDAAPSEQKKPAKPALILFFSLFLILPLLSMISDWAALFSAFYQTGSLVFGGGHVVLPLLQQALGETIAADRFLLGYAAAQAIPGPMFTLATFLGAELTPQMALPGALLATLAVFLPGFLLVLSLQGAWESFAARPRVAGAVWGINAAVVGLLLAALYQPVFISSVSSALDMVLVMIGFFLLQRIKPPILLLVAGFAGCGMILY